jgi:hypothetical protein
MLAWIAIVSPRKRIDTRAKKGGLYARYIMIYKCNSPWEMGWLSFMQIKQNIWNKVMSQRLLNLMDSLFSISEV